MLRGRGRFSWMDPISNILWVKDGQHLIAILPLKTYLMEFISTMYSSFTYEGLMVHKITLAFNTKSLVRQYFVA